MGTVVVNPATGGVTTEILAKAHGPIAGTAVVAGANAQADAGMNIDDGSPTRGGPADLFAEVDAVAARTAAARAPTLQSIFPEFQQAIFSGPSSSQLIRLLEVKRGKRSSGRDYTAQHYAPASIDVTARSAREVVGAKWPVRALYWWRVKTRYGKTAQKDRADVVELKRMAEVGSRSAAQALQSLKIDVYKKELFGFADDFDVLVAAIDKIEASEETTVKMSDLLAHAAAEAEAQADGKKPAVGEDPLKAVREKGSEVEVLRGRRKALQTKMLELIETFKVLVAHGNTSALDVLLERAGNLVVLQAVAKLSERSSYRERIEKYVAEYEILVPVGSLLKRSALTTFSRPRGTPRPPAI